MDNLYKSEGTYGQNVFCPWNSTDSEFGKLYSIDVKARSVVSPDRIWILYCLLKNALKNQGEIWECGVYKGGTAMFTASLMVILNNIRTFRLFDTFNGMPECNPSKDNHRKGDFSDTSLENVKIMIPHNFAVFHPGYMPQTFSGLNNPICFAHVDVDIYQSTLDCCNYIWPFLVKGGCMLFDDYGFPMTIGCRDALDEFCNDNKAFPVCLNTGQAFIFKN